MADDAGCREQTAAAAAADCRRSQQALPHHRHPQQRPGLPKPAGPQHHAARRPLATMTLQADTPNPLWSARMLLPPCAAMSSAALARPHRQLQRSHGPAHQQASLLSCAGQGRSKQLLDPFAEHDMKRLRAMQGCCCQYIRLVVGCHGMASHDAQPAMQCSPPPLPSHSWIMCGGLNWATHSRH